MPRGSVSEASSSSPPMRQRRWSRSRSDAASTPANCAPSRSPTWRRSARSTARCRTSVGSTASPTSAPSSMASRRACGRAARRCCASWARWCRGSGSGTCCTVSPVVPSAASPRSRGGAACRSAIRRSARRAGCWHRTSRCSRVWALGALIPPSYAEPWAQRHPASAGAGWRGPNVGSIAGPASPQLADHYVIEVTRR